MPTAWNARAVWGLRVDITTILGYEVPTLKSKQDGYYESFMTL